MDMLPFEFTKIGLEHVPRVIAANDTRGFVKLVILKPTN